MSYHYTARDPMGNLLEGDVDATSEDDAKEQIRREGLTLLDLSGESAGFQLQLFAPRVKRQTIIYTTNQLGLMVETGITLSTALNSVAQAEDNQTWKKVLEGLRETVESGEDFSTALSRYPKYFDETYVSLVKASESTGTLGEMLDRIATYLRRDFETRAKVRSAMAYPCVMLCMSVGIVIFLLVWVFPRFAPLFDRRGIELPKPTQVMLAISHFLTGYWYVAIGLAVALIVGFIWGKRTGPGREAWDWLKIRIPVLGPMFRKVIIGRSIRTLGAMLAGGVPLLTALELCSRVSVNIHYRRMWERVSDSVTEGKQICAALNGDPLMPSTLVQMIAAGEDTGKIDVVLARVSAFYDSEIEQTLKAATSIIEPVMIGVMGIVVGGIAMSLMLPIFSLSQMPH